MVRLHSNKNCQIIKGVCLTIVEVRHCLASLKWKLSNSKRCLSYHYWGKALSYCGKAFPYRGKIYHEPRCHSQAFPQWVNSFPNHIDPLLRYLFFIKSLQVKLATNVVRYYLIIVRLPTILDASGKPSHNGLMIFQNMQMTYHDIYFLPKPSKQALTLLW